MLVPKTKTHPPFQIKLTTFEQLRLFTWNTNSLHLWHTLFMAKSLKWAQIYELPKKKCYKNEEALSFPKLYHTLVQKYNKIL